MSLLSPKAREPHPDSRALSQTPDLTQNSKTGVDYEPHPEHSIQLDDERQKIVDSICRLYSGSASEEDMHVYAEKAIYDDPWSYCDTEYKIAGQWYGMLTLPFPDSLPFPIFPGLPTQSTLSTRTYKT
jgi:hypothetical protein